MDLARSEKIKIAKLCTKLDISVQPFESSPSSQIFELEKLETGSVSK